MNKNVRIKVNIDRHDVYNKRPRVKKKDEFMLLVAQFSILGLQDLFRAQNENNDIVMKTHQLNAKHESSCINKIRINVSWH